MDQDMQMAKGVAKFVIFSFNMKDYFALVADTDYEQNLETSNGKPSSESQCYK